MSDGWLPNSTPPLRLTLIFANFHHPQAYQTAKHEYQSTGKVPAGHAKRDLDRGFATSGMWAYSRHPNFAAEQAVWLVVYTWGCVAAGFLLYFVRGPIEAMLGA